MGGGCPPPPSSCHKRRANSGVLRVIHGSPVNVRAVSSGCIWPGWPAYGQSIARKFAVCATAPIMHFFGVPSCRFVYCAHLPVSYSHIEPAEILLSGKRMRRVDALLTLTRHASEPMAPAPYRDDFAGDALSTDDTEFVSDEGRLAPSTLTFTNFDGQCTDAPVAADAADAEAR